MGRMLGTVGPVTPTEARPAVQGTQGPAEPAAPRDEQTVSVFEFAKAWQRSPYQVRVWCRAGRIEGAYLDDTQPGRGRWVIPARHLPWMPGARIPSAGNKGGLG